MGSILALISDTITTGASVAGRVFALTGAVTLDSNAISAAVSGGGGQPCNDFTTGRGHITGPSGNDAEFKFKAGFKAGENADSSPHGEIVYIDDGFECSLRMKSTSVTAYLVKGPNSRRIQGTAEINGHNGTYQLDVTGDDSATDSFAIRLSNGYSASGKLKNGHIEIHTRCPNGKDDNDSKQKEEDQKDTMWPTASVTAAWNMTPSACRPARFTRTSWPGWKMAPTRRSLHENPTRKSSVRGTRLPERKD